MENSRLVPVGKITRTHGVRGAVKIYPYGESLAERSVGDPLYLGKADDSAPGLVLQIVAWRSQGKVWIGQFKDVSSMDDALRLVGREVWLPEQSLSPTAEGEYYYYQLIGLAVETSDGTPLGTLRGVLETGSNDVYVIECEGREVLVPALDDVIRQVDLTGGRMVVDLPQGLNDDL
jgi:16S rRNA processing protein RimM